MTLHAPAPPPKAVLDALVLHKGAIVALLRDAGGGWIAAQAITAALWDAEDWQTFYSERAAVRQFEGGYTKPEAEQLAWGEAVNLHHLILGKPALPDQCAGCGKLCSSAEESMTLPGDARVHSGDFDCLTAYGLRWRGEAEAALLDFGLARPDPLQ